MSDPSRLPDFDFDKAVAEVSKVLSRKTLKQNANRSTVADAEGVKDASTIKSQAPVWRILCRLTSTSPWQHGLLRYRGKTKDRVILTRTGKTVWLEKKNVAPYVFGYRNSEPKNTSVKVRDFKSGDTKVYSILVHSFPVNSATVPGDTYLKISKLLKAKLANVRPGTFLVGSVHGSTDDVGDPRRLNSLVQLRHRQVARAADQALGDFVQDLIARDPFNKIRLRANHAQAMQPEVRRYLFEKDPIRRSDPKIRPELRSAVITFRLKGDSIFYSPRKVPKEIWDGLRYILFTISRKRGDRDERKNAHIARLLHHYPRRHLRLRYYAYEDVRDYDIPHNNNYTIGDFERRMGGGSDAWDDILVTARHRLPTVAEVEAALTKMRKRMLGGYHYAQRAPSNQESGGYQSKLFKYMDKIDDGSVMYALHVK